MQGLVLSVALLLALVFPTRVLGLPNGAPAAACDTVTQQHPGTTPRSDENPYAPDLSPFGDDCEYVPGQTYTLTFAHPDGDEFRGFLWQARLCADDSFVSSGGFVEDTLPADAQLHDCSVPEAGVTHTNNEDKTSITVEWVAPDVDTGPITFAYAVTVQFDNYWPGADVRTKCINEDGDVTSERLRIGFEQRRYSVEEGEFLFVCVYVYGELDYEVYLKIYSDYQSYTSATPEEDFGPVYEEVYLAPGYYRSCIRVYTLEDYLLEGEEEFSLYLYFNDEYYYYYGDYYYPDIELYPNTAYIVIADDDIVKAGFEYYTYWVEEDAGYLEACLLLFDCPHDVIIYRPFQLRVYSEDGNATAYADYESTLELVTFHIGDYYYARQCFSVDIFEDANAEGDEFFTLHLISNDIQVYVPEYAAWAYVFIHESQNGNCTVLEDPEDGTVTISGLTPGSATADYVCDDGFAIVGPQRRVCQRNGEWTEDAPECIFFEICFNENTPYVSGNNVSISFSYTAPLEGADCQVCIGSRLPEPCSDGSITFYDLPVRRRRAVLVKVWAYAAVNQSAHIEREFRVDTNGACSAHLINKIYENDTHCVFEFQGTGPTTDDVVDTFDCSVWNVVLGGTDTLVDPPGITACDDSVYVLDKAGLNLAAGLYELRIRAGPDDDRCQRGNHRLGEITFSIE